MATERGCADWVLQKRIAFHYLDDTNCTIVSSAAMESDIAEVLPRP